MFTYIVMYCVLRVACKMICRFEKEEQKLSRPLFDESICKVKLDG